LLYTATEAAKYLGISRSTLKRWQDRGRITLQKDAVTGQSSFSKMELDKLRQKMSIEKKVPPVGKELSIRKASHQKTSRETRTDQEPSPVSENSASENLDLLAKLAQLTEAVRDIQYKQEELLKLLQENPRVAASSASPATKTLKSNSKSPKTRNTNQSPEDYTQKLLQNYETGDMVISPNQLLVNLLDRKMLAAELDKAWKLGDDSKSEWIKKVLHQQTT
jgi:excisionase family DNA binding protein